MPRRKLRPVTPDTPATVADLQRVTGLGENTVREAVKLGLLPGVKVGRRIVIPREAFERFCRGEWQPTNAARIDAVRPAKEVA